VQNTQKWFQKHSAERFANLGSTTLELMLETSKLNNPVSETDKQRIIRFFDIILNQQLLQQNVEEICLLVNNKNKVLAIDDGRVLFSFINNKELNYPDASDRHRNAIRLYDSVKTEMIKKEQIINVLSNKQTYHILVPFVLNGEFIGAFYVRNTADVSFIQREIISSYEEISIIYFALFLLGLLAMYYISSYTVKERNEAQKLLLDEHEHSIKQETEHRKEAMFTKRIYHTHHKAEKVMGFIKDDLRLLSSENIDEIKYRVSRYSSFISRVIYDMKWYDPPVHTIRNGAFKTDLNDVINFIIKNIFNRTSIKSNSFEFKLSLDKKIPPLSINEFVIWEVIEPLIQNCIDHAGDINLTINIKTEYHSLKNLTLLTISDNGPGILAELLEKDEKGVRKLFLENVSTKNQSESTGYGCYIAYEISKQRCGWKIDVENLIEGGCKFLIEIPH
jgi:hypothetical protein